MLIIFEPDYFLAKEMLKKSIKRLLGRHFVRAQSIRAGKWEALDESQTIFRKGVLNVSQSEKRQVHACAFASIHRIITIIRQCGLARCREGTSMTADSTFLKQACRSA